MATRKENIERLKKKTNLCLESRKNANDILDIIALSENDDENVVLASIKSLHKVFTRYISAEEMFHETELDATDTDLSKEEKYKIWLRERYQTVQDRLLELLHHENQLIQELSLSTLMKFVSVQGQSPLTKLQKKQIHFPVKLFSKIMSQLLTDTLDVGVLLSRFSEYLEYDDVRYFTLQGVIDNCRSRFTMKQNVSPLFLANVFAVLEHVNMSDVKEGELSRFMSIKPEFEHRVTIWKEHRRTFSAAWLQFLRFRLTASLYRKFLVMLHEKVIPHMTSPLMLSDFLTESYNIGGAISLLALNGVFILVHKYNLEYPEFYRKLYALLEPSIFHVKYRDRFFYLANLFLTSTHLPAYLVAAFLKKLSRLCLTAPASGLTLVIPFIYNLIIRHPICKQLINRTDDKSSCEEDPYNFSETDPAKCNALESSLWELQSLQSHYYPDVAVLTQKIEENFPTQETDLSDLLEVSTDSLYEKESKKKKLKTVALTFEPPRGLLSTKEDRLGLCWTIT